MDAGGLSPAKEKRAKSTEKTGCPTCVLLLIDASVGAIILSSDALVLAVAVEALDDRAQNFSVEPFEPKPVHPQRRETLLGNVNVNTAVTLDL